MVQAGGWVCGCHGAGRRLGLRVPRCRQAAGSAGATVQAGGWVCRLRVPRCKQAAGSAGATVQAGGWVCGCHGASRRLGLRVAGATVQAGGWVCGLRVPRCRQAAGSAGCWCHGAGRRLHFQHWKPRTAAAVGAFQRRLHCVGRHRRLRDARVRVALW
ncbi:uncharacterized protein LOC127032406 isoform X8 [Gopherus flavomarginatus]|uniref:uncharacterized protein LOC127032406 isoform X8 n=1 Tax=Gopherus flavomarginatus TaxID=286002 RepID=UPI0021CC34FB|nr:uncharacterized protein LOC127032406 isoform X8 [Gopherus flavomarginatus]